MSVEDEILALANEISALQEKFIRSSGEMFLPAEDQARFGRLVVEGKALLDQALGRANDFSLTLVRAVNAGSGGFFGGPSSLTVSETAEQLRGAVNHLRRRPLASTATIGNTALKPPYVDPTRLAEIRGIKGKAWDLTRLAQLCGELNVAHEHECHMSVAMLARAILDHVPPIFGARTFTEVANNHAGKSQKALLQKLDQSLRKIADAHLHVQIRSQEAVPSATQVDFRQELDALLQEVIRLVR